MKEDNKDFTVFTVNNVKDIHSGYWEEWESIIGKTVEVKRGLLDNDSSLKLMKEYGRVSVNPNGSIFVMIPGELKDDNGKLNNVKADRWLEHIFGKLLMDTPDKGRVINKLYNNNHKK